MTSQIARTCPIISLTALLLAGCVVFSGFAHAAETANFGAEGGMSIAPGGEFSWFAYAQVIGVMILVLLALWGVLWYMRRAGRLHSVPRAGSMPRDGLFLERHISLAPRKGLVVVRFLNKRLLLGVTEQQITLLTEMEMHDESQPFEACLQSAAAEPEVSPGLEPEGKVLF